MSVDQKNKCFVITPLGENGSQTRADAEKVIEQAIIPAMAEMFDVVLPHKIARVGNINTQIISEIISADIVIANLTDLNPNVMLELGIRFSFGLPVIIIAEQGTRLPFDISHCVLGDRGSPALSGS